MVEVCGWVSGGLEKGDGVVGQVHVFGLVPKWEGMWVSRWAGGRVGV